MNDERLQSLDKLYRDHAAALIRIAGAVTRDTEASQDIVQEAFVRAYTGWHKLEDGAEDARHWLVRVVVNLAIDHVRRGRVLHRQGASCGGSAVRSNGRRAIYRRRLASATAWPPRWAGCGHRSGRHWSFATTWATTMRPSPPSWGRQAEPLGRLSIEVTVAFAEISLRT